VRARLSDRCAVEQSGDGRALAEWRRKSGFGPVRRPTAELRQHVAVDDSDILVSAVRCFLRNTGVPLLESGLKLADASMYRSVQFSGTLTRELRLASPPGSFSALRW